jgi:CRISPR-associated protein Csm1
MNHRLMNASCRVALAAYLHDMGKFAERARVFQGDPRLEAHLTLYCPFHEQGRWFSHQHAANTALAFDAIESHLPNIVMGDMSPFNARQHAADESEREAVDSLVNAAAAHHKPDTFLQWIIATADRVASGFEREEFDRYNAARDERANGLNHFTSRQLTLFEQIRLNNEGLDEAKLSKRYALRAMSPRHIFPSEAGDCEKRDNRAAQAEYRELWDEFITGIKKIPPDHRANLTLWLDHFDSLWLAYTHAIPSATAFGVRPEVSLYDHSKTTAALAVALWRWHEDNAQTDQQAVVRLRSRSDFDEAKFLLIQGDFFGIQDFIFAAGGESRKQAAKLLRGRSFQVSLFTELAAVRLLDELGLPITSQIINAAGKFMIVAPNTEEVRGRLDRVRTELDEWFMKQTFGLAGIGLAWTPASCADFLRRDGAKNDGTPFAKLMNRLRQQLEAAKYQRLNLCTNGHGVFSETDFSRGVCAYNGQLPADGKSGELPSCALSRDQIAIGQSVDSS